MLVMVTNINKNKLLKLAVGLETRWLRLVYCGGCALQLGFYFVQRLKEKDKLIRILTLL